MQYNRTPCASEYNKPVSSLHQSIELHAPFVSHVAQTRFATTGSVVMPPDGCWDIVFIRHQGQLFILRTGLTTKSVTVHHSAGDEILAIVFKPHAFMPAFSATALRDEGQDLVKVGGNRFWLGNELYEVPTLETAADFAAKLAQKQTVENSEVVESLLAGRPKAMSVRTMQRHFLKTTGLTYKAFKQIMRAQKAVQLLQTGQPALQVAFSLGYTDQSHLINSLKSIMGQTPKQISKTS